MIVVFLPPSCSEEELEGDGSGENGKMVFTG